MSELEQALFDFARVGRETLALPDKPSCTPKEAATATGVSERQIRYWVADGTLLAINAAREPIAIAERKHTKLDRYRVVVRRPEHIPVKSKNTFLSLEELVGKISNINAG